MDNDIAFTQITPFHITAGRSGVALLLRAPRQLIGWCPFIGRPLSDNLGDLPVYRVHGLCIHVNPSALHEGIVFLTFDIRGAPVRTHLPPLRDRAYKPCARRTQPRA